jgi:hypothetical protein
MEVSGGSLTPEILTIQIEFPSVIPSGVGREREKKWFACDDAGFQREEGVFSLRSEHSS